MECALHAREVMVGGGGGGGCFGQRFSLLLRSGFSGGFFLFGKEIAFDFV